MNIRTCWTAPLPWGRPYRVFFSREGDRIGIEIFRKLSEEDAVIDRYEVLALVMDTATGKTVRELSLPSDHGFCCFGPTPGTLVIRIRAIVCLWHQETGKMMTSMKQEVGSPPQQHGRGDDEYQVTPDGRFLFHVWGKGIGIYNLPARKFHFFCRIPDASPPAGSKISAGSAFWGQPEPVFRGGAISPDCQWGAVAGTDLVVFDLRQGKVVTRLPVEASAIAFSSDGRELLAGQEDGVLHLFDTGTWQSLTSLSVGGVAVRIVGLDARSSTLVLGLADQPLQFRDHRRPSDLPTGYPPLLPPVLCRQSPDATRAVVIHSENQATLLEFPR